MVVTRTTSLLIVLASWGLAVCAGPGKPTAPTHRKTTVEAGLSIALEETALENLQRVSERIYCGAEPKDAKAFGDLARLGIKTVVSVDGIRPDIERAKRHGMRYVHIPIGYDGVDNTACASLTRLVREAEGPFYIHCHHGRHRGPAAAAIARVADGGQPGKAAVALLVRSNTDPKFVGLFRDVSNFKPTKVPTDRLPELVAVAEVPSIAEQMAHADRLVDSLKAISKRGWVAQLDDARSDAVLLEEAFHEMARTSLDDSALRSDLEKTEVLAKSLNKALSREDRTAIETSLHAILTRCTSCHQQHRD